jgi:hypothetical protein
MVPGAWDSQEVADIWNKDNTVRRVWPNTENRQPPNCCRCQLCRRACCHRLLLLSAVLEGLLPLPAATVSCAGGPAAAAC